VTDLEEGALSGRFGIWTESHEVFRSRPIHGAGLDAHRAAIPTGKEAHNTYVSVLAETGVIGLLLFGGVMLSVVARVRSSVASDGRYWIVQLAVLAIGAMSLSLEDSKSVWIFLSLAVASGAAAAPRRRAPEVAYRLVSNGGPPRADLAAVDEASESGDFDRAISALESELEASRDGATKPRLPGRAVDRGVRRR
jgi:hypothetical protein